MKFLTPTFDFDFVVFAESAIPHFLTSSTEKHLASTEKSPLLESFWWNYYRSYLCSVSYEAS